MEKRRKLCRSGHNDDFILHYCFDDDTLYTVVHIGVEIKNEILFFLFLGGPQNLFVFPPPYMLCMGRKKNLILFFLYPELYTKMSLSE